MTSRAISSGLGQARGPVVSLTKLSEWLRGTEQTLCRSGFGSGSGCDAGTRTGTVLSTSISGWKDWPHAFMHPFCCGWDAASILCCKASPGCYLIQEGQQIPREICFWVSWTRLATGYFYQVLSISTVWAKSCASRLRMLSMQTSSTPE